MYKTLIKALFSAKDFTVYGFDYTECAKHTTITTYCWRDNKPDINVLVKGVYAETLPKDYKVISTNVTRLGDKLKFYEIQPHSNQIDTKNIKEWLPSKRKALDLLYNVEDAPFTTHPGPSKNISCSCGESCFVNKTALDIHVYTCYKCKLRFFWYANVLTFCYEYRNHKDKELATLEKPTIKFVDPKGVELKMQLGSCGHAWVPLREGKKCPTCFLTNTILKSLSTLHASVDKLKQEMAGLKSSGRGLFKDI
jgi:hypothetical protein